VEAIDEKEIDKFLAPLASDVEVRFTGQGTQIKLSDGRWRGHGLASKKLDP